MAKITVEKYVAGTLENSFGVPLFAVNILAQLLPASASKELAGRGIDLQAILNARQQGTSYRSSVEVTEDGVEKMVVITVA